MTKIKVLEFFVKCTNWAFPDDVWGFFDKRIARVSVYTFLLRLWRQKLLVRTSNDRRIAYSISKKGRDRLTFLKNRENKNES
jgi:DNA-binding PadR family transcriptional regulator